MSDRAVGDALLKLDLSPPPAPSAEQVERIIESDQRRVKRLTRLAVGLWVAAALGALLIFVAGGFVFPAIRKTLVQAGQNDLDPANMPFQMLAKLTAASIVVGSLSFVLLVTAGLATVVLVFRSRRATLRQINANLLVISEQLKRLAPPPAGPTAAESAS